MLLISQCPFILRQKNQLKTSVIIILIYLVFQQRVLGFLLYMGHGVGLTWLYLNLEKILKEEPIDVFNHGKMSRDFTYIDDIVESIVRLFKVIPSIPANRISQPVSDSISPVAPWRTVNIGGSNPIELEKFIGILEEKIGKKAKKRYLGMQQGDVENTQADISLLKDLTNFIPQTSVDKGIENFLNWYLEYNKLGMQ